MTEHHPQESEFESLLEEYPVRLRNFEGPLDLLLHLIKKNEVNIYDIPIALITQQYLEYLELMQELNLDVAGEFLVMAATLIHIKSRMLLPRPDPTQEDPEEDPREALAVPELAVLDQIDGAYVYRIRTAEGGPSAELVRIQAGQRSGGMAEVTAGLDEGDQIITEGVQSVRPGQPVRFAGEGGGDLRGRGSGQRPAAQQQTPRPGG